MGHIAVLNTMASLRSRLESKELLPISYGYLETKDQTRATSASSEFWKLPCIVNKVFYVIHLRCRVVYLLFFLQLEGVSVVECRQQFSFEHNEWYFRRVGLRPSQGFVLPSKMGMFYCKSWKEFRPGFRECQCCQ